MSIKKYAEATTRHEQAVNRLIREKRIPVLRIGHAPFIIAIGGVAPEPVKNGQSISMKVNPDFSVELPLSESAKCWFKSVIEEGKPGILSFEEALLAARLPFPGFVSVVPKTGDKPEATNLAPLLGTNLTEPKEDNTASEDGKSFTFMPT